ncbi:coiled-coil domain-containing protein 107 [Orycteropus afer afer]|uniref:Coiled-coil domain-containing protein 107 n=1 Tax=Orycteropus afer afer TaxID=1230840 RepID=A0AC54ZBQ2_ORYAF|nr:coiled-coil domain-containing protein 107 [Orycteropus afer afer]
MPGPVSLWAVLGLLLVSLLPGLLRDRPSPDLRARPGDPTQASEARRRPPPKEQRERARAGALPLGALYTAAVVAFVLYKCLQGKDEAAAPQEADTGPLQSEQQLAQLTQQLAQAEQHLNSLMAQLDPLFEWWKGRPGSGTRFIFPRTEAGVRFPEDAGAEAGSPNAETWSPAAAWEAEQGLRRRSGRAVAEGKQRQLQVQGRRGCCRGPELLRAARPSRLATRPLEVPRAQWASEQSFPY